MAYPKVVAFDLELVSPRRPPCFAPMRTYIISSGTIWSNWLDPNSIGRRGRVGRALEDNLEIIDNEIIADRRYVHSLFLTLTYLQMHLRNPSQQVRVSPHIHLIMDDLISNGAIAVIVSKNPNEQLYVYSVISWFFEPYRNHRCNRAMWLLRTQIPRGSRERPFIDFISYNEIYSGR